jgi:hypothetical protein
MYEFYAVNQLHRAILTVGYDWRSRPPEPTNLMCAEAGVPSPL